MNPFEKILDRICKAFLLSYNNDYSEGLLTAKTIVQEVAEEYNGGWIPCSERLPNDCEIHEVTAQFGNGKTYTEYAYYDKAREEWWKHDDDGLANVIAWKEPTEPYKERD